MVDRFACILPVLSKRFSNFQSLPECHLPLDHECWQIWPSKKNNTFPNAFATHAELYGYALEGSPLNVVQEKYEKALKGPLKRRKIGLDGTPCEERGMPWTPPIRELAGVFEHEGNWIPRMAGIPTSVVIKHSSVTDTVSWMLGAVMI
eukprot:1913829-Amphidinium_carterae.1